MDRKVIIAVVVSILFLMLYPYYMKKVYPPAPVDKTATIPQDAQGDNTSSLAESSTAKSKKDAVSKSASQAVFGQLKKLVGIRPKRPKRNKPLNPYVKGSEPVTETNDSVVTIETPLYRAVVSSLGGAIKSFELKKYKESLAKDSPFVNMASRVNGEYPLLTRFKIPGIPEKINFSFNDKDFILGNNEERTLILSWNSPEGLRVEKSYTFSATTYQIDSSLTLINGSKQKIEGSATNVLTSVYYEQVKRFHSGPVTFQDEKASRLKSDEDAELGQGTVKWIGLEDKFFLLAFMPETEVEFNWTQDFTTEESARTELTFLAQLNPGEKTTLNLSTYIGPKEYKILKNMDGDIEEAIQFGWFSFMAKPVLVLLNFFKRFVGNYGIAIIILTVLIKLAFYPLSKKSMNSMKDMQLLQPQMTAIKKKYKEDKQQQNKEIMALYKRHKVNPLGGCLPMVLQIPAFIALYEVLSVAIDLRHAPFMLWITDLSASDPYYISPILMGGSMFIQQKMSPSSMDPTQAKMMLMMPIVFTFLFLNFPTGLVIYWLVNNILTIAQQYQIHRKRS